MRITGVFSGVSAAGVAALGVLYLLMAGGCASEDDGVNAGNGVPVKCDVMLDKTKSSLADAVSIKADYRDDLRAAGLNDEEIARMSGLTFEHQMRAYIEFDQCAQRHGARRGST